MLVCDRVAREWDLTLEVLSVASVLYRVLTQGPPVLGVTPGVRDTRRTQGAKWDTCCFGGRGGWQKAQGDSGPCLVLLTAVSPTSSTGPGHSRCSVSAGCLTGRGEGLAGL